MRAIMIDPFEHTVSEVEYDGNWQSIGPMCGYELFTLVNIDDYQSIYVDDEGLFKENQCFFVWEGYPQMLAGKGLILSSDDEGDTQPATITVAEVEAMVTFIHTQEERTIR